MENDRYFGVDKDIAGEESLTKFEGFHINRYLEPFTTGISFVFATKPSLFLSSVSENDELDDLAYNNMERDSLFSQFLKSDSTTTTNDHYIVDFLSYKEDNLGSFIPLITNRLKAFSPIDTVMEQRNAFGTKQGYNLPLPSFKTQSEATNTFSISLNETKNLDITKMMMLWVNYISNITDGTFNPNPQMVRSGVIDYMNSFYYFVLEDDGRTLKYWAKYTGCWPSVIPYSQLSFNKGERALVNPDLQFTYTIKEDMSLAILEDFNKTSLQLSANESVDKSRLSYISKRESKFLNKDKLKAIIQRNSNVRGPLVFLREGANNQDEKFELAFPRDVYEDLYNKQKFEEDYFYDEENDFLSDLD